MRKEWPLSPRPGQIEIAKRLADLMLSGGRVSLSAPVGWGKTMTVLAALVEADLTPVVWMGRSLTLGKRVGEDAALWGLRTFLAAGRERTCLLADELGEAVHEYCRLMKYACQYARPPRSTLFPLSFKELVDMGRREGWCPYYAQDLIEADVYFQSYYRRLPRAKAFVIDEAHNLLIPKEKSYRLSSLAEAAATARELGASDKLARALESLIRYAAVKDGPLDASLFLDNRLLAELRLLRWEALRRRDKRLHPLLEVTRGVAYVEGERVLVFKPSRVPPMRPAVFVSATLPELAADFFKIDAEIRVPWRKRLRAFILEDVTTKFDEFDTSMALRYRKLLIAAAKRFDRLLVFAASERVARELKAFAAYYECRPPRGWTGIALFRARGRFSEGVDLPADAVIVAGCPYLPPEVGERLARMYKLAGVEKPLGAAIDVPMLTTTLQCVGRATRSPAATPMVVLADSRFRRYVKELEKYFLVDAHPLDALFQRPVVDLNAPQ